MIIMIIIIKYNRVINITIIITKYNIVIYMINIIIIKSII